MSEEEVFPTQEIHIHLPGDNGSTRNIDIEDISISSLSNHHPKDTNDEHPTNNTTTKKNLHREQCVFDICSYSSNYEDESTIDTKKMNAVLTPQQRKKQEEIIQYKNVDTNDHNVETLYLSPSGSSMSVDDHNDKKDEAIQTPELKRAIQIIQSKTSTNFSNLRAELKELAWEEEVGRMYYIEKQQIQNVRSNLDIKPTDDLFLQFKAHLREILNQRLQKVKRKHPKHFKVKKRKT